MQPSRPLLTEHIGPDYLKPIKPDISLYGYQVRALQDQQARSRVRLEEGLQALLHRAKRVGMTTDPA